MRKNIFYRIQCDVQKNDTEFDNLDRVKRYIDRMDVKEREAIYGAGSNAEIVKWKDNGCCEMEILRIQEFVCKKGIVKYNRPTIFRHPKKEVK